LHAHDEAESKYDQADDGNDAEPQTCWTPPGRSVQSLSPFVHGRPLTPRSAQD
jgi:hypothetical protein